MADAKNVTTIAEFIDAVKSAFGANGSFPPVNAAVNLNINMGGNAYKVIITNNN